MFRVLEFNGNSDLSRSKINPECFRKSWPARIATEFKSLQDKLPEDWVNFNEGKGTLPAYIVSGIKLWREVKYQA